MSEPIQEVNEDVSSEGRVDLEVKWAEADARHPGGQVG